MIFSKIFNYKSYLLFTTVQAAKNLFEKFFAACTVVLP
ncbi:hypothetical protein RUMTOR_00550 [[Ruminococcus] torques ATCC 27756]|uniref:Uncharacterized protein n=1 Tax=[Ruminococcus] torques ATCC 27756 TaxID=411460 RepID=A5KK01_9FIRM|nr:hypothetical protein RUMTOR_00550 [[Ruminococcus] torques ATCC 27756]